MNIINTEIEGLIIIEPKIFDDERGYFYESFHKEKYGLLEIKENFVQDNVSKSVKNTIRGLHYQVGDFAQGKLCSVLYGKVIDIAVDIRFNSPTFGKYVKVELSEENKRQFWIPKGFAHGFSVLSDIAIFSYKCTALYNSKSERAIIYNDSHINIEWEVDKPILSAKDLEANPFNKIEKDFF